MQSISPLCCDAAAAPPCHGPIDLGGEGDAAEAEQILFVSPDRIDAGVKWWHPRQVLEEPELDLLAASIHTCSEGVEQPLTVRPSSVPGHYELVAGKRRLLAAERAGVDLVPIRIRILTDDEAAVVALCENAARKGLRPLEIGWAAAPVVERGRWQQKEIAEMIGLKENTLSEYLTIARGIPFDHAEATAADVGIPVSKVVQLPKRALLPIAQAGEASERGRLLRAALLTVAHGGSAVQAVEEACGTGGKLYTIRFDGESLHLHIPRVADLGPEHAAELLRALVKGIWQLLEGSPASPWRSGVRAAKWVGSGLWKWITGKFAEFAARLRGAEA